jgi:hypothetical protein
MPEGDTVYLAAKRMAAALSDQRLTRGELRHPRLAEHDLSGRTVLGVHSVGEQQWVFSCTTWHCWPPRTNTGSSGTWALTCSTPIGTTTTQL